MPRRPSHSTVLAAAVLGALAGALAPATPSSAEPPSLPATFTCKDGSTMVLDVTVGNAFRVPSSTAVFIVVSGFVTGPDGVTVVKKPNGTQKTRDLLECSYVAPRSGRSVTVSGFFTPAR